MKDTFGLRRKSMHDIQCSTEKVGMHPFQAPCKIIRLLPVLCACQLETNKAVSPCNEDNLVKNYQIISIPVTLL